MDPATFYGVPPTFSVQPASAPTYSLRPRRVNPAERDASLSATSSEGSLRRSHREKKPRISDEKAENLRRSARERKTRVVSGVAPLTVPEDPAPRKRTLSVSVLQNGARAAQSAVKKQKMDGKKAQTLVVNERRDVRDRARKKWFYYHKQLFEPLLHSSSAYFETLKNEIERLDSKAIVPLHELDEQPALISEATLKDYQLTGLSFLVWMYKNGMNCILGDEMGLGKTLQTLSLFAWMKENETSVYDPQLVICPLSVLQSWESEAARWLPSVSTLRFHGVATERTRIKEALRRGEIEQPQIVFTTYETFVAEDSWFKSQRWTYCVLDEGHKIKNADTNISGKLQGLGCLYRLILTGTPIQNNLVELWSLLHWLYPSVFTDASERLFKDSFDMSKGSYNMSFLNAAKELVSKIMLRRTKASVEINVPPREEMTIFVPLTEAQRFWTYRLLTRMDSADLREIFLQGSKIKVEDRAVHEGRQEVLSMLEDQMKQEREEKLDFRKLMNLLLQLRKVCDHPYMLPDAPPEPYSLGEHIVAASSKLIVIDKLLADILPKGERVLIFSQWTMMLDYLEDFLSLRSIKYARLDGSTHRPRRRLDIKLFQMEKSPYQVFLVSTRAGGLGINLTKATHVIMCDSDWNPQNDLQAIARAHRIGQTKTVKVYRLICQGSVEDQMLDRIRRKLFLSVKIMGSNNSSSENTSLDSSELLDILRKGSSALMRSDDSMDLSWFLDASLEDILHDSKKIEEMRDVRFKRDVKKEECDDHDTKLLEDAEEEEGRLLKGVAQVQSRFFEGRMIQRQSNTEIANEWQDLQKRARTGRMVNVDGMAFIVSESTAPEVVVAKPMKKQRIKFESEEWCNYCRDGGELVLCNLCPRVFHLQCHGISKATIARMLHVACSQHACNTCLRSTGDAGGMLFRCQTCHQAFCEDCLPFDDIEPVGESLPEFELLGYPTKTNAYYIRCHDCVNEFQENPSLWESWQEEFRQVQRKLERKLQLN
ncbi:P-loop containing nucleoside triphosphate hydrolase protein [Amanita rubescens]|nr:P-loop containing nucleoside triphosphate hydrolase protein [Amanita rubescens]